MANATGIGPDAAKRQEGDWRGCPFGQHQSHKYDRYLADVFLATEDGEVFLNNELLGAGHAAVKRGWEFADWGGR
jgi:endonuclease YncB( thermonuclease family)